MNDDQLLHEVGQWLHDADPEPPDAHERVRQAMVRAPQVRQRGRWWPLPVPGRPSKPRDNDQPSPNPASNGHSPTVIGRTQSMLGPVKTITAGAIVALLGGFLLAGALTQPSDEQVPAAVTDSPAPTSELPSGVDLVTEDVELGVVRVVSDGHRMVSPTGDDSAAEEPRPSDPLPYPIGDSRVIVRDDGRVWVVLSRGFYELGREPMVEFPGQDFMTYDDEVAVGPDDSFYKLLGWRPQSWKPAKKHELWRYDGSGWAPEEIEAGSARADRLWTAPDGSIRATKDREDFQRLDSGWVLVTDTADSGDGGTPATTENGTQPLVRLSGTRAASPDYDDEEVCAGLDRLDGEATQHYLTDLCIYDFDIGPDGRIWAIAHDEPRDAGGSGGLYIIDPGASTTTEAAVKEPPSIAQGRQRPSASPKEDIVKRTRTPAATALALGLIASAAPAVTAQDEVIAPVEFTAHVSQVTDCSSRDFEGVVDGVGQSRGYRCQTTVEDSSDPRFSGTWLLVFGEDGYGEEDGTTTGGGADTVWTYEYRVENDDGAWQSGPVSGVEFDEREMTVAPVFTGEGAYEGLTAIVEMSDRETDAGGASDASLRGAIFVGSPPPPSGFPTAE